MELRVQKRMIQGVVLSGFVVTLLVAAGTTLKYVISGGKHPLRLLNFVASGVFGQAAFQGEAATQMAVLGAVLHVANGVNIFSDSNTSWSFKNMVNIIFVSCLFITVTLNAQQSISDKKPMMDPKIFEPGVISTGDYESHVQFSQDGKTVYYLKSTPSFSAWTIVESHHENGRWSEPEVSPFSGRYSDADPFITPDGKKFFFISNRPVDNKPKEDLDIWVMDKTVNGWSEPRHLDAPVNSDANEWFPTLTSEGTIYFGSERAGGKGGCDIYRATWRDGKYQTAENLGDLINTPFGEYEPLIAPDESYLIYESGKPGGFGSGDLYISYNRNGRWTAGRNLGDKINSSGYELGAKISPGGKYFFWMSTRENSDVNASRRNYSKLIEHLHAPGNGLGDIYQIDIDVLRISENK